MAVAGPDLPGATGKPRRGARAHHFRERRQRPCYLPGNVAFPTVRIYSYGAASPGCSLSV